MVTTIFPRGICWYRRSSQGLHIRHDLDSPLCAIALAASILAAARDSMLPSGKSPGIGVEFVAGRGARFCILFIILASWTEKRCFGYCVSEPCGQSPIACICFELFFTHALKQLVQVDVFAAFYPLSLCVDFRKR